VKKNCIGCNKELDISKFDKYPKKYENKTVFYFKSRCRSCHREISKVRLRVFKKKNPTYFINYNKDWEKENYVNRNEYRKQRWIENKDELSKKHKEWYFKNKDKRKKYNNQFYEVNREKLLPKARKRTNIRRKDPILSKKDYLKAYEKIKIQRATGHPRAIWNRLRARIIAWNKTHRTKTGEYLMKHINCSKIFLKYYLELQFYKDKNSGKMMSWDNYPLWHIDHIVPLSKFSKLDKEKKKYANHFLNLRPLWPKENFSKGARLEKGFGIKNIIKKSKFLPQIKYDLFKHKSCLSDLVMNGKNPNSNNRKENLQDAKKLAEMVRERLF